MNSADSLTLGMAALQLGIHNMITSAERGHTSPSDVDVSLEGVIATLENLSPEVLALVMKQLDPQFANLKKIAAANWKSS